MLNLLATPARRRVLFTALYLSEGAPIGYIWWALPTRLKVAGMDEAAITFLTGILVLPWTFKFLWAPLVDVARGPRWGRRQWIIAAQITLGAALVPVAWLDPVEHYHLLMGVLLVHAVAAATQDAAIDALCIAHTTHDERGRINGWMQAGMRTGQALMGGGALILSARIGSTAVIPLLIGIATFSMLLVLMAREPAEQSAEVADDGPPAFAVFFRQLGEALRGRGMWIGLVFALSAGAAFEATGALAGPMLIAHGQTQEQNGYFFFLPVIVCLATGSLAGGWLADRLGHRLTAAGGIVWTVAPIVVLAGLLYLPATGAGIGVSASATAIQACLLFMYFGVGLFTAAQYALLMDLTRRTVAATQFSTFMGATNGCEAWAGMVAGQLVAGFGYFLALVAMCGVSLLAMPLLSMVPRRRGD